MRCCRVLGGRAGDLCCWREAAGERRRGRVGSVGKVVARGSVEGWEGGEGIGLVVLGRRTDWSWSAVRGGEGRGGSGMLRLNSRGCSGLGVVEMRRTCAGREALAADSAEPSAIPKVVERVMSCCSSSSGLLVQTEEQDIGCDTRSGTLQLSWSWQILGCRHQCLVASKLLSALSSTMIFGFVECENLYLCEAAETALAAADAGGLLLASPGRIGELAISGANHWTVDEAVVRSGPWEAVLSG